MPQVLHTSTADAGSALQVQGRALHAQHAAITGTLRSRLGFNHAELLAAPRVGRDGAIAWSTGLVGPVTPAQALSDIDRERLVTRAERLLQDIQSLARQLHAEGGASAESAEALELALQTPPAAAGQAPLLPWLYSVGGKPVLVMWGHVAPGAAMPPAAAWSAAVSAAASSAAPTTLGGAAGASPAGGASTAGASATAAAAGAATTRRPWWHWLLGALLALALLATLLFGLKRCTGGASVDDELARAEARNQALEEELLRKRARDPRFVCVPDQPAPPPPAASAPASAPPPALPPSAPAPASAPPPPPPQPTPAELLKKRVSDAGTNCNRLTEMLKKEPLLQGSGAEAAEARRAVQQKLQTHCKEQVIREAKNLCPGQRPPELAPELVVVFDASGSMRYNVNLTDAQIRQAEGNAAIEGVLRGLLSGGRPPSGNAALEAVTREPTRMTVARQATQAVVQRVPSDMSVGLVMVDECPSARPQGFFAPGQRGALLSRIQGIEPRKGTPLADGIRQAAAMVDGTKREALIVVVSDGTESCNGDPCAVAAQIRASKPYVKINVVDITGTGAGNCVAAATGGQVFTARNADEVVQMTQRAAQDAMGPQNCKRP